MPEATNNSYGSISKVFHWVFAVVIFWQLFTGVNLHNMEFSPQKGQFIWLHQITGTFLFCFIALRLVWCFYYRPKFEDKLPKTHKIVSKTVHITLYILCLWLPIQGTMMTWAGGFDVYIIGLIKVPTLLAENKLMYPTFIDIHFISSITLLLLTMIHILAGFYHRIIINDKHGVWKRMAINFHSN